jgi:hypothetical protein
MTSPFAIPEMAALRRRLAKPDINTLRVWNGNEGPTLEQLVDAVPPAGGVAALVEDIRNRQEPPMEGKPAPPATPRRPERRERDRPYRPHTDHLREFDLPDGRTILADRRGLCFAIAAKPQDFGGKEVTILAFRSSVKGVPVLCPYDEVKAWWMGRRAAPAAQVAR